MKKKIISILLCGVIVLEITGCGNKNTLEKEKIHTFNAIIIECEQNSMIVRPEENEEEYKSSDKFRINFVEDFSASACSINNNVRISYIGSINESYPAQINTTKIEISKSSKTNFNYTKTIDNYIIEMNIPDEWHYEELPIEENYKFALKINKDGNNDYFVLYYLNNSFAVCGTGRSVKKLKLDNGKTARIGYYDADKRWSDISFYEENPNIVLENHGTKDKNVFSFIKTINIKKAN